MYNEVKIFYLTTNLTYFILQPFFIKNINLFILIQARDYDTWYTFKKRNNDWRLPNVIIK